MADGGPVYVTAVPTPAAAIATRPQMAAIATFEATAGAGLAAGKPEGPEL